MQRHITEFWGESGRAITTLVGILVLVAHPWAAAAQGVAELAVAAAGLNSFAPRFAQDSPTGLRSPGEHSFTRVWSATGVTATPRPRACFAMPIPEPLPSTGACGKSAAELLVPPSAPQGNDPMADLLGATRAFSGAVAGS